MIAGDTVGRMLAGDRTVITGGITISITYKRTLCTVASSQGSSVFEIDELTIIKIDKQSSRQNVTDPVEQDVIQADITVKNP